MNQALLDRITHAVLYEGYLLYPYRPSVKNRQRWTFGSLVPQSYRLAQGGAEPWTMQTECLAAGSRCSTLTVQVRFLHLVDRQVGKLTEPLVDLPAQREPSFQRIDVLEVDGRLYHCWQEAVERQILLKDFCLEELQDQVQTSPFTFPAGRELEPLRTAGGELVGVLVRQQQILKGSIELSAQQVTDGLFKLRVRILNQTPINESCQKSRDEVLMHGLASTSIILGIQQGDFVSLIDPPEDWRAFAGSCRNEGAWPVLVGDPGDQDTILSAPIILYDYPQIAPESAGDFFDATEIDEMLALRVRTLTDEEKGTMAAIDAQAQALLQRTESLSGEQLLGLHGTMRVRQRMEREDGHG